MRLIPLLLLLVLFACTPDQAPPASWSYYGGDPGLSHYSEATQIDTANVDQLVPLWTYHTGDADTANFSQIQCNPIVVDGSLYGVTPQMRLFAAEAATGMEKWVFDPQDVALDENGSRFKHNMINARGLAHWKGDGGTRLFFTAGSLTYAIDAADGAIITSFGNGGHIDLHKGLGRNVDDDFIVSTSPGIVYQDVLVMGTRVNESLPAAPGHIRAYDVRTGEQKWIFRTIPGPTDEGFDTWDNKSAWEYTGGANAWSGFSMDKGRGLIFCGTGSASYDFYGGNRPGENLYANCVLALDALTGERRWHYQTVHHDLWDKDHPTPPVLVTVNHAGKDIAAVAQPTKNGYLFVLDRETGKPVFPVTETPVPQAGAMPGEQLHPTQPIPDKPAPFARQVVGPGDINPYLSEADREVVAEVFRTHRYGNPYLPPGKQPFILLPGFDGGAEWGGPAFDPKENMLYVNSSNMAWLIDMREVEWTPRGDENWAAAGQRLYVKHCQTCHGEDRIGTGNNPTLINIGERYETSSFAELIRSGRRMMPAFGHLKEEEVAALASFVLEQETEGKQPFTLKPLSPGEDPYFIPWKMNGYKKFLAPDGKPAISPPWGTLTAIDLNTGEHRWQIPLGEYPDYKAKGLPATGTENYGGPVITAGGVLFIAATSDGKFRAFNKRTGVLLWETDLPAAGFATPAVYEIDGKQLVVIACGGGKLGTRAGDSYVAFGLPE
ncbi:outer membrane protein assembly factor BamB family protein [Neolewinella persica]|uniref:outer membrane protein assembly factor BamB family protein n=1 Tax=Neolewinella persica TaxID=70998 RepID=UPI0003656D6A|nr:PQQ-binding-like beta-propeller repeat protein [Neolewinella persica]